MKKIFLIALITLVFTSCKDKKVSETGETVNNEIKNSN